MNIQEKVEAYLGKPVAQASNKEIYDGLLTVVQEMAAEKERTDSKKKLYYISAEFLIGKLLSNNMINLGIYQEVKEMLEKNGKDICEIEEAEPEPSLGNGGLGRLAACFLDSIATLGLAGDGLSRSLKITCRKRLRTRGSRRSHGLRRLTRYIRYSSKD